MKIKFFNILSTILILTFILYPIYFCNSAGLLTQSANRWIKDDGSEFSNVEWISKCFELYAKEVRKEYQKKLILEQIDNEEGESSSSSFDD